MKIYNYFLLLLLISVGVYPQIQTSSIEGYVRDMNNYQPVGYANVYLSGTTLGTTTDKGGYYKISNIPQGKNTLVASITGYKAISQEVYLFKHSQIKKDFMLVAKVYDLGSVDVVGSAEEWRQQLEYFKPFFLGRTPNAEKCKIVNEIEISFDEDDKYFRASAPNALKIINESMGYKIDCVLNHFVYDKENKIYQLKVFTEFEDIADSSDENILFYQMIRRKGTYQGSIPHLLLTLIKDKVVEERFELTMWEDPEWPSYEVVEEVGELITYNSFVNTYTLKFSDYLKIKYVSMLQGGGHSVIWAPREVKYVGGQNSWLVLPEGKAEIDAYGNFINPDEFVLRGYYGKLGVADMLPKYVKYDAVK